MQRAWLGGLALWLILMNAGPALAQAPPAGSADQLRELAQRLIALPFVTVGTLSPLSVTPNPQAPTAELLPGQLPGDLPLTVPVPPGGRLVGSAVRRLEGRALSFEVVLDAPGTSEQLLAFYEQTLPPQGWGATPLGRPAGAAGGFVPALRTPTPFGYAGSNFCQTANGPWLSVIVAPLTAELRDLRVRLQMEGAGPCAAPEGTMGPGGPPGVPTNRLPALYAPPGAALMPSGGGGSSNSWTSSAIMESSQSATALEAYFAQQLEAAGWTRQAGGTGDAVAWSTWLLPEEDGWRGALFIFAWPGEDRRFLTVRVESPGAVLGALPFSPPPGQGLSPADTR